MADLLGTNAFWRIYAAVYDALWDDALTELVARAVVEALASCAPPPRRVLEVGAGTGLVTVVLAEAGYTVEASEPVDAMRRRFQVRLPMVRVQNARLDQLVPPAQQDQQGHGSVRGRPIVAANVLHLVRDPAAALESLRMLAGEAPVIVATPAQGASVAATVVGKRRAGVPYWRIARFVVLQAVLVPVIAVLGPRSGSDRPVGAVLNRTPEDVVGGCVAIHCLR